MVISTNVEFEYRIYFLKLLVSLVIVWMVSGRIIV